MLPALAAAPLRPHPTTKRESTAVAPAAEEDINFYFEILSLYIL